MKIRPTMIFILKEKRMRYLGLTYSLENGRLRKARLATWRVVRNSIRTLLQECRHILSFTDQLSCLNLKALALVE